MFFITKTSSASIKISRSFSTNIEKNSQNYLILNSLYSQNAYKFNQGGPSHLSYSDGALSISNSPVIAPNQDFLSKNTLKKTIKQYTVIKGDNLTLIAKKFNVSEKTITEENNIKKGKLKIGQNLNILPVSGLSYIVKKNDNIWLIAKRYSVKREEILKFNEITGKNLKIGKKIIIPNAKKPSVKILRKYKSREIGFDSFTNIQWAGDGNVSNYLTWRGIVSYGKGARISVPKRQKGRYRYTRTNYGYFTHPTPSTLRTQGIHHRNGVDMGGPIGTDIYAAADGKIIKSYYAGKTTWGGGYGNHILIQHSNGIITMYGHLSKNLVIKNENVKKGQIIGKMGSTGNSTGSHLHFEVRGAYNPF